MFKQMTLPALVRHASAVLASLVLCGLSTGTASAGLFVNIASESIGPGSTAVIDVLITSDSNLDQLYGFQVEYVITGTSGRDLFFVADGMGIPPDTQLTDPAYVFASTGSAAIDNPPAGAVGPATTYAGLDASNSPTGVSGPFTRLLTRLSITAATANAPLIGDVFQIDLVVTGTQFFDPNLDPLTLTSHTAGTITVTPEPATLMLFGLGLVAVPMVARRRLRG